MTFSEAVRSGFTHYVRFDGRAPRPAFWWWQLFAVLAAIAVSVLDGTLFEESMVLTLFVWLVLTPPSISVAIRRLHDTDRSGWWVLIMLVPVVGLIALLVLCAQNGEPRDNRYGPPAAA